jgi:quinol monooxygenase YgiN
MAKHSVLVELTTQPGKRDEVIALWHSLVREFDEQNADCTEIVLTTDNDDETKIRLIEFYTDAAAFGRVMESAEVGALIEQAQPLFAAPPSIVQSTPVWAKTMTLD